MRAMLALIVLAMSISACAGKTVQMMQADCQVQFPATSYRQEWACIQSELSRSTRHQMPRLAHYTAEYRVFGNLLQEAVERQLVDDTSAKILLLQFANQIDRDIVASQQATAASMQALSSSLNANRPLSCSTYFFGNNAQTNCN